MLRQSLNTSKKQDAYGQALLNAYQRTSRGFSLRAFTLIELLVVLAIISMLLSLGVLSISTMLDSNKLWSAKTILQSAVTRTKSQAMSTRRSCALDISTSATTPETLRLYTSSIIVSEDFEQYAFTEAGYSEENRGAAITESNIDESLFEEWAFDISSGNYWYLSDVDSRVLHYKAPVSSSVKPSMAWNIAGGGELDEDSDNTLTAKFKVLSSLDTDGNWEVGAIVKMSRSVNGFKGYRVRLSTMAGENGWCQSSVVFLEKLFNPGRSSTSEIVLEGTDGQYVDSDGDTHVIKAMRAFDASNIATSAIFTTGIWYRVKINARTEKSITVVAAKVWIDGMPEPNDWTVGPLYDYDSATLTTAEKAEAEGLIDSFAGGKVTGAFVGLWTNSAEVIFDDVTSDTKEKLPLTKGIRIAAIQRDMTTGNIKLDGDNDPIEAGRYQSDGFPIIYRPDGTMASDRELVLQIKNLNDNSTLFLKVNPTTGSVDEVQ